jgi:hypothetical protein
MFRSAGRAASIVTAVAAMIPVLCVLGGGGCEAIVSGTIEPFRCDSNAASACPTGEVCAPATGKCIPASSACVDNPCTPPLVCDPSTQECVQGTPPLADAHEERPPPLRDVSQPEVIPPPDVSPGDVQIDPSCGGAVGCPCAGPKDCAAGNLCADSSVLPGLANNGFFCTKTCCTSSDCPSGDVCYLSGAPGNYCVGEQLLDPTGEIGTGQGGASCTMGSDCRSGNCTSSHCVDTCCTDASCASGAFCAATTAVVNGQTGFLCTAEDAEGDSGDFCTDNDTVDDTGECNSGVCGDDFKCTPMCCGAASCTSSGFKSCQRYEIPNGSSGNDYIDICAGASSGSAFGSACMTDSDCSSTVCDPSAKTCTDYCCVDSDCAGFGTTYVCRPAEDTPRYLICIQGG